MASAVPAPAVPGAWTQLARPVVVVAKYRYVATERTHVSFNFGDELEVTHAAVGWYRGRSLVTRQPGVVPLQLHHPGRPDGAGVHDGSGCLDGRVD